jgi:3-phosphoshikimate 1-carboxyvinyltransferase
MEVVVEPCEALSGEVDIPGDKSLSHRSVMLAALSDSHIHISGFLPGLDALASLQAIQKIGISIDILSPTEIKVYGQGMRHFTELLSQQNLELDFQNAGTGIRLFSGLLASATGQIKLTGDESLSRRPMKRITEPLRQMGVDIRGSSLENPFKKSSEEFAPLYINQNIISSKIKLRHKLKPLNYVLPQASAQVKSCLLLAGLFAEGETILSEPIQTRDHSERMLQNFGVKIQKQGKKIFLQGNPKETKLALRDTEYKIVKDFSSAAFFIVAALIAKQAEIVIKRVGLNPTRTGLLSVLLRMGADIRVDNLSMISGEPVGDLFISNKNKLTGVHVNAETLALMIDEFPIFLLAALKASGPTVIEGIEELAYKESNRIESMVNGLTQLGAKFELVPNEHKLIISPLDFNLKSNLNLVLDSTKDHRVAMSFFMASLLGVGQIKIQAIENIYTSFPSFFEEARKIGFSFKIITNQGGASCQR